MFETQREVQERCEVVEGAFPCHRTQKQRDASVAGTAADCPPADGGPEIVSLSASHAHPPPTVLAPTAGEQRLPGTASPPAAERSCPAAWSLAGHLGSCHRGESQLERSRLALKEICSVWPQALI